MTTNAELAGACIGLESRQVGQVQLRPFRAADFDALHAIISSREDMTWERVRATPEYSRQLLDYRLEHYSKHGFGVMAIEEPTGGLVGQAGLQALHDLECGEVELVVFLHPNLVGKGLGSTLGEYFKMVSRECNLSEIYATVRPQNGAAERWIRKLGFEFLRDAVHFGVPCRLWRLGLAEG